MSDELNLSGANLSGGRPSDEMAQYLQLYLDETTEQLDGLVDALLVLEGEPTNASQLNEAFRLIHSIKGSSSMMGLDSVAVLTHHLENHFERLRSQLQLLDEATLNLILRCIDFLRECNGRLRAGQTLASSAELLEELAGLATAGGAVEPDDTAATRALPAAESHLNRVEPPLEETADAERAYLVALQFEPGLQLVELKAELAISRLADVAEIRDTDPGPSEAHRLAESSWLQILVVSERSVEELRSAVDVDGIQLIEIAADVAEFRAPSSGDAPTPPPDRRQETPSLPAIPAAASTEPAELAEPVEPKARVTDTIRVDIDRLDNLMNLAGELVVNKARFVQIARSMSSGFKKSSLSGRGRAFSQAMRRALAVMKAQQESLGGEAAPWSDQLHDFEAELAAIEEQSRLWDESRRGFAQLTEAIDHLTRVSNSLQRGVLETRMVPVAPLFNRFKRVVRDIAQELDKKVRLEIHGEKTELDKRMIDELGDPLVHLIRNAIDHGIESAETRAARGKPEMGTIVLEAAHSGNSVFITVRDDGGGLNADRIRRGVAERGLLSADAAAALSDREAIEFIWHPGFSTAAVVSGISGRGVGMDIVKTRIAELNGTIDVETSPGKGTTFTVRLPLTLAIIRSLLFRLRHGVFAAPIENVREIVSVPCDRIVTIHGRQTFDNRGEFLPLVDIEDVFDWSGVKGDRNGSPVTRIDVVILYAANRHIGLRVDELHGGQDIVIKSLAENFTHIRGLSGASILGDGSVCLLLDVAAAIDLATSPRERGSAPVSA